MHLFLQVTAPGSWSLMLISFFSLATGMFMGWLYWYNQTGRHEKRMNDPRLDELQARNSKLKAELEDLQAHHASLRAEMKLPNPTVA